MSFIATMLASIRTAKFFPFLFVLFGSHTAQAAFLFTIFLILPCILVYFVTWLRFTTQRSSKESIKVPPTVPYMVPFLGSAFSFALDPAKCLSATSQTVGSQAAYGLKILNNTLYFLNGAENVALIWKYKTSITTPGVQTFCLLSLFKMSPKAVNMYNLDTSGIQSKPNPDSKVAPHNRIDYLTHAGFHKLLSGDGLSKFYRRWSTDFVGRLPALGITHEWVVNPDIMDFWISPLTASLNEALTGPILECVNPNFTREFNRYIPFVHGLMKGLPRWLLPEAFTLRDRLIGNVKQWHAIARARFRDSDLDEDGDADPWWGCAAMRERQKTLGRVENWDHDAIASSDFGLLWGANINVHTAAIWAIVEIFRDKTLLSRVRAELEAAGFTGITSSQEIDKLLSLPLLQSVHAEVLRLRVEVQSVFYSEREDIHINEWRFPKKNIVLVPTGVAHRDKSFWNTRDGAHPVDKFWADRFLVYPNDPLSGPERKTVAALDRAKHKKTQNVKDSGVPKFISSGLADSFMPFGVGERTCPGRFFARREMVGFCAQIVHELDIEILSTEEEFEMSPEFYGLGTQRPLRSIPFRMRRRTSEY